MQSQCVLKPGQSHKPTLTLTPTAAQAKNDAAFPFPSPTCLAHLLFKDMHTWLRQLQKIAISVRLLCAPSESSERAKKRRRARLIRNLPGHSGARWLSHRALLERLNGDSCARASGEANEYTKVCVRLPPSVLCAGDVGTIEVR